jgi:hypothetical protein
MSTIVVVQGRPVLLAGLMAGVAAAIINAAYYLVYGALTARQYAETGAFGIALSSIIPPLLGAASALVLSRFTRRAGTVFAVVTLGITAASLLPGLSSTLPDGTPKPACFDGLVLPMHVVVGALAGWLIPRSMKGSATP